MAEYAFAHNGTAHTPSGQRIDPAVVADHNAAIERAELRTWRDQPSHAFAYYDEKTSRVTTWLGTSLGRIDRWKVYRHNFGGRLVAIHVVGTNGASYHGRASYDHGTCIRLRKDGGR